MTLTKKFTAIAAVLAIGVLSIYATTANFLTANKTAQTITVTLNLQSGASTSVTVASGESVPTDIGGDAVLSLTIFGALDPAGVNAIVPNLSGGTVVVRWQGTNAAEVDPSEVG